MAFYSHQSHQILKYTSKVKLQLQVASCPHVFQLYPINHISKSSHSLTFPVPSGGISGEQQPGSSAGRARCAAAFCQRERRRDFLPETAGPAAAGLSGPGERPTEPGAGGSESSATAAGTLTVYCKDGQQETSFKNEKKASTSPSGGGPHYRS